MRKILLLTAFVLFICANFTQAQTEQPTNFAKKGTKLFNPQLLNLGFSSLSLKFGDSDENANWSQFGLAASGGYAIEDNLFIIGQVGAQSFKFEDLKFSFISLGGGVRYYLPNNFYGGAGLLLNHGKIKGSLGDSGFDDEDMGSVDNDGLSTTLIDFRLEAGYSYFLLPSVALEPSISYGIKIAGGAIDSYDENLGYSRLGINLGVSIFF